MIPSQPSERPWPEWGRRRGLVGEPNATPHARDATTPPPPRRSARDNVARTSGASAHLLTNNQLVQRKLEATRGGVMAQAQSHAVRAVTALLAFALVAPHFVAIAQPPPTAERSIAKDRIFRLSAGKTIAKPPQPGFFGTIFHLILEQINDTKSAYNQVSELVNNQFTDDNVATTPAPDATGNVTTTESTKISRQEFLKILDRNLKGLSRLRDLEWREARKDSWNNLRGYKNELFGGKKPRKKRLIKL